MQRLLPHYITSSARVPSILKKAPVVKWFMTLLKYPAGRPTNWLASRGRGSRGLAGKGVGSSPTWGSNISFLFARLLEVENGLIMDGLTRQLYRVARYRCVLDKKAVVEVSKVACMTATFLYCS
jgi:hypothetical protein